MTVLALLRHAKAVKDAAGGDHARALSDAGRRAAAKAGTRLASFLPDDALVLASDARRTRETAELAFPTHPAARIRLDPALYAARPGTLMRALRDLPSDVEAAVLVGHNPGISELASALAGDGDADALAQVAQGLATADAVVFTFATDWADLAPKGGRITAMLPRTDADD